MNFADKKQAYHQLQGKEHLDADKELLLKKAPKSPALKVGTVDREKAQREIVWALLDVASVEEIIANRPEPVKKLTKEEMDIIVAEAAKLTAQIHNAKTLEEKDEIVCKVVDLTDNLPNEVAVTILTHAESIVPDFVKTAVFIEKLIGVDFSTAKQPELAGIARGLKIEAPDYKLATLRPILEKYRLNLPKTGEGTGEKTTEVVADNDKVNELTEENEALKSELDDKEVENADLQEQLDETQANLEETEAKLEEEKKSESKVDPE